LTCRRRSIAQLFSRTGEYTVKRPGIILAKGKFMSNFTMAVFIISCALAAAVNSPAQEAPKEHSMTGCLKQGDAPGTYMITDVEGNGPKSIGIVATTANLAPHVGHKIAITGTAVSPKEAEMDKNIPKAPHYMKVSAVKMLSPTCP
jgi:hypothetical protein